MINRGGEGVLFVIRWTPKASSGDQLAAEGIRR
jgi:hypothetical protein